MPFDSIDDICKKPRPTNPLQRLRWDWCQMFDLYGKLMDLLIRVTRVAGPNSPRPDWSALKADLDRLTEARQALFLKLDTDRDDLWPKDCVAGVMLELGCEAATSPVYVEVDGTLRPISGVFYTADRDGEKVAVIGVK